MKYKNFEDYLMDIYILDDQIPDGFNDWIYYLEPDEWLVYGEQYANYLTKELKDERS